MKGLIVWVLSVILSVAGIQDLGLLSSGQKLIILKTNP